MTKRLLLSWACLALLCACGGHKYGSAKDGEAVAFQRRTFKLLKTPDPQFELAIEGMLSSSYEAVVKSHSELSPAGVGFFAYSVSPKGAAYPFSEIEVSCLMQERYARGRGPELCGEFFTQLSRRIAAELAARQPKQ